MPMWGIAHLLHSETAGRLSRALAKAIRIGDLKSLETLPMALILGYFIPTILMAIPVPSNTLHQWLGGLWQGFPVWVSLFQWLLHSIPQLGGGALQVNSRLENRYLLYSAYWFAFASTSISHLATLATIAVQSILPSVFSPLALDTLTLKEVFIPPNFQNPGPMKSMAAGIHNFFQYDQYVGSTAALAWAVAIRFNARKSEMSFKDWAWLVGELIGVGIVAGPAGALVAVMWNRDESILLDDELYEGK